MNKLAIRGGKPIRTELFPEHNNIGTEEIEAVTRVIKGGKLSRYLGTWHENFYGGEEVQGLEQEWAEKFGVKHAISVNSATSGLYCAVGAAGVGPGDEVIVSPYTMAASATAPLIFNAVPIFADVEKDGFCLDPVSVESKITKNTKAIIVVDIFGQPYDVERINAIARRHNLIVIEDAAQAPGAKYRDRNAGTLGDMGVYSLNYHKHIHSGEGGIIVTDNDELADRLRLIRNHAEAVVEKKGYSSLVNMIGYNFRMTEIEAAISRVQLTKLDALIKARIRNVEYFESRIKDIPCLTVPPVREGCQHVYYQHLLLFDEKKAGVTRDVFVKAIQAELPTHHMRENEGTKIGSGYVKPLYLQPLFQNLIAYNETHCPFKCPFYDGKPDYSLGTCPVCEDLHYKSLIAHEFILPSMTESDINDVLDAFNKVWEHRSELME